MSSEPPTKKAKASWDATVPAVSDGGVHITPELVARMATFADANNSPDVMNIYLAAGPAFSRTIKHFYLSRNDKYLIDTLKNLYTPRVLNNIDNIEDMRREKAGANHRAWMEVNTDWKTIVVSDDSIRTMLRPQVHQKIMKGSHPFIAFSSTAFAVELGLMEVVKFLIEDKGVDPNEYGWALRLIYRVHLVSAAMAFGQEDIFQYLLSLPSTNLHSAIDDNQNRHGCHGLFEQALVTYVGSRKEKAYLTSFVNHNRFDVNRACHGHRDYTNTDFTCLDITLYRLQEFLEREYGQSGAEDPDLTKNDSDCLDRYIDVIKILLEAGANPNQDVGFFSGIDLIEGWRENVRYHSNLHSNPLLIESVYGQVLAMMRETRASST